MLPLQKSKPLPAMAAVQIYQFHVLLLKISSAIWRRFLIRSDSTIADLHHTLQIVMGWDDEHLHQFTIHGKHYGVAHPGGSYFSTDPTTIRLDDFKLCLKERFLYEYDLNDYWLHQVRLEQILPFKASKTYPFFLVSLVKEKLPTRTAVVLKDLWNKKLRWN